LGGLLIECLTDRLIYNLAKLKYLYRSFTDDIREIVPVGLHPFLERSEPAHNAAFPLQGLAAANPLSKTHTFQAPW
jgi:hypothetical protein